MPGAFFCPILHVIINIHLLVLSQIIYHLPMSNNIIYIFILLIGLRLYLPVVFVRRKATNYLVIVSLGRGRSREITMSVDDNTQPSSDSGGRINADPLGIIGWEIGGKYKIKSYIGGGGFGEVYDAYNLNLVEQRLVIKFFKRVQARDRFDREAKILCMLDHPNISRVIDFLPDEGALVVQFIDGQDAAQILRKSGALPAAQFLKVARSITEAIAYAHDKKVAHRDIKPANILIDKNGHVFLIDFGIAKEVGGAATKTGYQALTPMFAAPERQTGESSYNPFLSDIYELGITLFNFCTNTMPYRNPISPSLQEWGGIHAEPLSSQLRFILKKATHPDPSVRYQTAAEMAKDLNDLTEVYVKPKKKRTGLIATAALVIVIAAAAYFGRDYIAGALQAEAPDESVAMANQNEAADKDATTEEVPAGDEMATETKQEVVQQKTTQPAGQEESSVIEPPAEEVVVVRESAPPPTPELTIRVKPEGVSEMFVDGMKRRPGEAFEAAAGSHTVEIIHREFPVLGKTIRLREESADITYEMAREFAGSDSLSIQLALFPPSEKNMVEFNLNGRARRYTQFPVFDLMCLAGKWNLSSEIIPINDETGSNPKIDSCVTFPYGGGPRHKISGSRGVIELLAGESGNTVPLLVYWSE